MKEVDYNEMNLQKEPMTSLDNARAISNQVADLMLMQDSSAPSKYVDVNEWGFPAPQKEFFGELGPYKKPFAPQQEPECPGALKNKFGGPKTFI